MNQNIFGWKFNLLRILSTSRFPLFSPGEAQGQGQAAQGHLSLPAVGCRWKPGEVEIWQYVWYHQPFLNQKYGQTPCFWWLVVLTDTNLRSLYIKVEQTGQDLAFSPSDLLTWCLVLGRGTNVNFVTHCWNSAIACPNLAWWFADTVFSIRSRDIAADFMLSGFVETTKLRKTKCQGDQ